MTRVEGASAPVIAQSEGRSRHRVVCFPLEGFNTSGGIRVIITIANGLSKAGYRVRFVVPEYASTPPFPLEEGVAVQAVAVRGGRPLAKLHYFLISCIMSARSADVCFATGYKTPFYLSASKLLSRSPVKLVYLIQHYEPMSHVHFSSKPRYLRPPLSLLAKLSYRLPLTKVAVSHWITQQLGGAPVRVIGNGVDRKLFRPSASRPEQGDPFVVGTVGNSAPWKGYNVFLEALAHLPLEERAGLKVLVASQQQLKLPDSVRSELVRPSNDNEMAEFYNRCHAFAFTSTIEGFGLPPLEAMACGVPVVTTDCGGVRDFADEQNALIVPPGDPEALAQALLRLKADAACRARLQGQGLATADGLSADGVQARYLSLMEELH